MYADIDSDDVRDSAGMCEMYAQIDPARIRDSVGMCSERQELVDSISSLRSTTTDINDQMKNMLESYISRQTVSTCVKFLIRANHHIITNYVSKVIDDSLQNIQNVANTANEKFNLTIRKLQEQANDALCSFRDCCRSKAHFLVIEQTRQDVEKAITDKLKEADSIYESIKQKLNETETIIRSLPIKFANCLATEDSVGSVPVPIAQCLKMIGGEMVKATPTTMQLVLEGNKAGQILFGLADCLFEVSLGKLLSTKDELSMACLEVGTCLNQINLPFRYPGFERCFAM